MFGSSDSNRSQDQGGHREVLSAKEGGGKEAAAGTRTGSEARTRATSVLGNAKSNRHRKTRLVEPGGTTRKFTRLTRGGLRRESVGGVSRGRSSDEVRVTPGGAKGRRDRVRREDRTAPPRRARRAPKPAGRDNYPAETGTIVPRRIKRFEVIGHQPTCARY